MAMANTDSSNVEDLINLLDKLKCNQPETISTYTDCVKAVIRVLSSKPLSYRVIGLNCEFTSHTGTKGDFPTPAILSLSTTDGYTAVFQLKLLERKAKDKKTAFQLFLPSGIDILKEVLEDASILKVGVGVVSDARYLEETYGLVVKGCLDLRYLVDHLQEEPKGLHELAKRFLGAQPLKINKVKKVGWDSEYLPEKQVEYTANQAQYGIKLFLLFNGRSVVSWYPKRLRQSWHEENFWEYSLKLWERHIGKPFPLKKGKAQQNLCLLLCHNRQLEWHHKTLPYFDPATPCLVCGSSKEVTLRAIVPEDYFGPNKSQCNYCIMCHDCLSLWRQQEYKLREELTQHCGAPRPNYNDVELKTAKTFANKMIKETPAEVQEYKSKLNKLLGTTQSTLPPGFLAVILNMDCWFETDHGQFIRHYYEHFYPKVTDAPCAIWYNRFSNTMKPKCKPRSLQAFDQTMDRVLCYLSKEDSLMD